MRREVGVHNLCLGWGSHLRVNEVQVEEDLRLVNNDLFSAVILVFRWLRWQKLC